MRYTVHFQNTTKEWVLFDNVFFYMLSERFNSEKDAQLEASFLADADRRRAPRTNRSRGLNAS